MNEYEVQRLENIKRNEALFKELGIKELATKQPRSTNPPAKKRKLDDLNAKPTRTSARIASIPAPAIAVEYSSDEDRSRDVSLRDTSKKPSRGSVKNSTKIPTRLKALQNIDVDAYRAGWTAWKPEAAPPSRDTTTGRFRFQGRPYFSPNVSPEEMLREGVFGGSYFRPLYTRRLAITVEGDWQELPSSWTEGLDIEKAVTSPDYDPEQNKFGAACGQSIEEWEAAGWIDHYHDVRGWFQWYCRYFQGRRSVDDDRQISRWKKCVGETGRWRRALLKKYASMGVTDVEVGHEEVSPVMHQTCFQWALRVTQADLDDYLETGR